MIAVELAVCVSLIRSELAGYQGYPHTVVGEERFGRALQEVVVSVDHAIAVLQKFTEKFPTVQNIIDVALNLKPQFERQESELDRMRREFGEPQKFTAPADIMALHWQAIRNQLYWTGGPGVGELHKLYGSKDRQWSEGYWREALNDSANIHGDTLEFIMELIKRIGWPAAMAMNDAPPGMPYTHPLKPARAIPHTAKIINEMDIRQAEREYHAQRQAAAVEVIEPEYEVLNPTVDDSWEDPDR